MIEPERNFNGTVDWEIGTGYDLFASAFVLHRPRNYALPAPWAAGVRGRMSPEGRAALKDYFGGDLAYAFFMPLHLVHLLPSPRDAAATLALLRGVPDDRFLATIHHPFDVDEQNDAHDGFTIIQQAMLGERITEVERQRFRTWAAKETKPKWNTAEIDALFIMLTDQAATKERYLAALEEYYRVYFAAEEERSAPILAEALAQAKSAAAHRPFLELLEELSHGFTFSANISDLRRLTIVPSFWTKPYVFQYRISQDHTLLLYGARPEEARLVPGAAVPDAAIRTLKTLADPTRLRLLRLLAEQPRAPQEMAREIKLSLPTILHHLHELRLAGLVRLEVGDKGARMYYLRWQEAEAALASVRGFVKQTEG